MDHGTRDFTSAPLHTQFIYILFLQFYGLCLNCVAIYCFKEKLSADLYGIGNVDSHSAPRESNNWMCSSPSALQKMISRCPWAHQGVSIVKCSSCELMESIYGLILCCAWAHQTLFIAQYSGINELTRSYNTMGYIFICRYPNSIRPSVLYTNSIPGFCVNLSFKAWSCYWHMQVPPIFGPLLSSTSSPKMHSCILTCLSSTIDHSWSSDFRFSTQVSK